MAGGKVSARQKMINMMYLVLTALLALNVSKEIIKAFNLMENSLDNSTKSINEKNLAIEKSIMKEAEQGSAQAKAALVHYKTASEVSKKLIDRIKEIKKELEKRAEGRKTDPEGQLVKGGVPELMQGDNMEIHSHYFVVENGGKNGKDFQGLINKTREELLGVLDKAISDPILSGGDATKKFLMGKRDALKAKTTLSAEDHKNSEGKTESWITMYLEHSPLAAVFALLSKIENDTKSMEAEVEQALAESVGASAIKFDSVIPVIRAATSAVLTNQAYEADIILAAYDSKSDMKMTVNGSPIEVKDGMGKYKSSSANPGEQEFTVGITVPKPGGGTEVKTEKGKFSVFAPSAAISADELNVIYEGLDNPLSISVAGVNPNDVQVSINAPGGDVQLVKAGAGKYKALCPARKGNEAFISVSAKVGDRTVPMGSKKFKIRRVPRPTFMIGPFDFSQPVTLSALKAQRAAAAVLENFVYDGVSYSIQGYHFTALSKTAGLKEAYSNSASTQGIAGILAALKPGDFIQFDQIKAVGPGGVKYLPGVGATLK